MFVFKVRQKLVIPDNHAEPSPEITRSCSQQCFEKQDLSYCTMIQDAFIQTLGREQLVLRILLCTQLRDGKT